MVSESFKKKVGLFSGSFNPIHIGHLALANWLCEFTDLDEVWFMVTPHNPLKEKDGLMDDQLRLDMVEKAIENYPKFKACDLEFHLPQPSYTISTLEALNEKYPDQSFTLIIGSDNWSCFNKWKDYQKILSDYELIVYPRLGSKPVINSSLYPNVRLVNAPIIEISSTFIRESMKEGKDVRYFMPESIRGMFKKLSD